MDYTHDNGVSPPPLDDVSSAADTDGDFEDFDLEVNAVNSCTATSIAPKQYKSFQPSIRVQPTDLVYREEHSRAAPRKGIEPKAFLTIGETKQEHIEYVGRKKQPVTAPSKQPRQTASAANTRKHQQRQSSVHSAPAFNRTKSRPSRTASGKGRHSGWSSAGYTPLPVAPPPSMPTKENAYIHHPFKQDQSYDYHRLDTSAFEEHRLSTMDEFVASLAYQSVPSRCSTSTESKRPVSPGEEMKNSTILATMEVGKYINQREKTPKAQTYRESKLLKARLRPLHTVNVDGPAIGDCQGIQADKRKFGPSPMKAKQQKQLDDVIKKNAAIKDISAASYGSRYRRKPSSTSTFLTQCSTSDPHSVKAAPSSLGRHKNTTIARAYQVAYQARADDMSAHTTDRHSTLIYPSQPPFPVASQPKRKEQILPDTSTISGVKVSRVTKSFVHPYCVEIAMETSHPHSSMLMIVKPTQPLKACHQHQVGDYIKTCYSAYMRFIPPVYHLSQPSAPTVIEQPPPFPPSDVSGRGYDASQSNMDSSDSVSLPFTVDSQRLRQLYEDGWFGSSRSSDSEQDIPKPTLVDQSAGSSDDELIYVNRLPGDVKVVDLGKIASENSSRQSHHSSQAVNVPPRYSRRNLGSTITLPPIADGHVEQKSQRLRKPTHLPRLKGKVKGRSAVERGIHTSQIDSCKEKLCVRGNSVSLNASRPHPVLVNKGMGKTTPIHNAWMEKADMYYDTKLLTRSADCNQRRWIHKINSFAPGRQL